MRNFYIFLDYDGVMWSFDLLKKEGIKPLINSLIRYHAGKENISALNHLILSLKDKVNPVIVITSERRRALHKIKQALISGGLIECDFDTIPIKCFKAKNILIKRYLDTFKESNNFIIIDDFTSSYKSFGEDKIIKTSIFNGGLTKDKVDKFLNTKENII